jgi:Mor family transcriptional regulator
MGRRLNQKDIINTYRRIIIRMLYRDWNFSCADIGKIFRISRQRVWRIVRERKCSEKNRKLRKKERKSGKKKFSGY